MCQSDGTYRDGCLQQLTAGAVHRKQMFLELLWLGLRSEFQIVRQHFTLQY
jgi:hypothetical protein